MGKGVENLRLPVFPLVEGGIVSPTPLYAPEAVHREWRKSFARMAAEEAGDGEKAAADAGKTPQSNHPSRSRPGGAYATGWMVWSLVQSASCAAPWGVSDPMAAWPVTA